MKENSCPHRRDSLKERRKRKRKRKDIALPPFYIKTTPLLRPKDSFFLSAFKIKYLGKDKFFLRSSFRNGGYFKGM
jgi:hypothetical protein